MPTNFVEDYIVKTAKIRTKYPSSFSQFANDELQKFDETFIGTVNECKTRRKEYEEELKANYKKIINAKNQELNKALEELKSNIYSEYSWKNIPNSRKVFNKLWDKAWADSHSCGMSAVVDAFDDIKAEFDEIIAIMQKK